MGEPVLASIGKTMPAALHELSLAGDRLPHFKESKPRRYPFKCHSFSDLQFHNRYEKQEINHTHTRRAVRPMIGRLGSHGVSSDWVAGKLRIVMFMCFKIRTI